MNKPLLGHMLALLELSWMRLEGEPDTSVATMGVKAVQKMTWDELDGDERKAVRRIDLLIKREKSRARSYHEAQTHGDTGLPQEGG